MGYGKAEEEESRRAERIALAFMRAERIALAFMRAERIALAFVRAERIALAFMRAESIESSPGRYGSTGCPCTTTRSRNRRRTARRCARVGMSVGKGRDERA